MTKQDITDLMVEAHPYGMRVRKCTQWHWQILTGFGKPLVNYWPSSGKYGKAIEQHSVTPDIPMKAKVGTIREALDFAADVLITGQNWPANRRG